MQQKEDGSGLGNGVDQKSSQQGKHPYVASSLQSSSDERQPYETGVGIQS